LKTKCVCEVFAEVLTEVLIKDLDCVRFGAGFKECLHASLLFSPLLFLL
jgi:hypothetical protein